MPEPSTITLRGSDELEYRSAPASGEVRPGHLLEKSGQNVQVHSTAGAKTAPLIAIERRSVGMVADDPDGEHDTYSDSESVLYVVPDSGYQFYGLLAGGETVAVGDQLVSAGDGTFRLLNSGNTGESHEDVIAEAAEAVDNSGSSSATRFRFQTL
jgi:hypothetical protein